MDTFPVDVLAWAGIARLTVVVFDALVQRATRVYTRAAAEQRAAVPYPCGSVGTCTPAPAGGSPCVTVASLRAEVR